MLPRRQDDVIERAKAEIIMPPEMAEAGAIPMLPHQLDPRLRWDDDDDAKNQRDQQPRAARPHKRPHPAQLRKQRRARIARNQAQQRQPPTVRQPHRKDRKSKRLNSSPQSALQMPS